MENKPAIPESSSHWLEIINDIPSAFKKNFIRSACQLVTTLVDIPKAMLEGRAAEIRALTDVRVKIINGLGDSIIEQISAPPEYVAKATNLYSAKIVRESINLEKIAFVAAKELQNPKIETKKEPTGDISPNWLNEFESEGRKMSTEDMQLLFGKILAGEISNPGAFSKRTIRLVAQLDNRTAVLFRRACSLSTSLYAGRELLLDSRVLTFGKSAGSNSLSPFNLSFNDLNILEEAGLIISDYNSYMTYNGAVADENNSCSLVLKLMNKEFGLLPIEREKVPKVLTLNGVAFTSSARELLSIIPIEPAPGYQASLEDFLKTKSLILDPIIEKM